MLRAAPVIAFAFAVTVGRVASGASPAAWLEWSPPDVPEACGNAESFAGRVEQALGHSPALAAGDAHVTVRARISRVSGAETPGRWVGEIHLRGDGQQELGSRTLDRRDLSCRSLVDALAVVTALALANDGMVAAAPEAPPAEPAPAGPSPTGEPPRATPAPGPDAPRAVPAREPEAAPVPPRVPVLPVARGDQAVLSRAQPSRSRDWRTGVEGGAKVGVGLLPRTAWGAEVSANLRPGGGWKVFLAFGAWERQTKLDDLGRGASFERMAVGLGICPLTTARGPWTGAACVRGDLGRLRIAGIGFATSSTEDRLTLDGGAGVELQRRLVGPLAIGVTAAVMAPVIRDRISYAAADGTIDSIYRQAPLAAIGSLRLSCVF